MQFIGNKGRVSLLTGLSLFGICALLACTPPNQSTIHPAERSPAPAQAAPKAQETRISKATNHEPVVDVVAAQATDQDPGHLTARKPSDPEPVERAQVAPSLDAHPHEPTDAEVEELLLAAENGNAGDLLDVIDLQTQEKRPWELSAQGPPSELDYEEQVQSALYQAYAIEPDSKAVGRPNRGHLQNGEPLPANPELYTIRRRNAAYASSHTALQVVTAFRNFRRDTGYQGKILIADISPKKGGKYRMHHSHQTGRDLDILMPLQPGHTQWGKNIDWDTTWALVRAFLETKEVEYVFLDYKIQKHLHAAAQRAGEHPEKLKGLISWPVGIWNKTIIRDSPGHWAHFHVRIKCGPTETRCRSFH